MLDTVGMFLDEVLKCARPKLLDFIRKGYITELTLVAD